MWKHYFQHKATIEAQINTSASALHRGITEC